MGFALLEELSCALLSCACQNLFKMREEFGSVCQNIDDEARLSFERGIIRVDHKLEGVAPQAN